MASLSTAQYKFLLDVQTKLTSVIKGVGGISHEKWRTYHTERREKPAWHYIDGDLIEQFLDLPLHLKEKVCVCVCVCVRVRASLLFVLVFVFVCARARSTHPHQARACVGKTSALLLVLLRLLRAPRVDKELALGRTSTRVRQIPSPFSLC